MPTRIAYTDQQLLDYSEEHLLYELHIFRWVAENLPPEKGFLLSALLESFAIHLRNLIDFFYTQPGKARNDDLVAADFFDSPGAWDPGAIPKSLEDARERANKEISHVTYKRKTATDPTKPWPVGDLFKEVHSVAQKFAAGASSKKLHPSVITWLKSDPKAVTFLLISASTTTSNTAASIVSGGGGASASNKAAVSTGPGGASPSSKSTI
ncbi:MAG: hypothetical protein ABSG77_08565 [Candidatus Acidiferrum sp.]